MSSVPGHVDRIVRRLSLAAICTSAVVLLGTAVVLTVPSARAMVAPAARGPAGLAIGDRVPLPGFDGHDAKPVLLVYFRSDCAVCQRNQGAIRDVVKAAEGKGIGVRFVSTPGRAAADLVFAEDLGVVPVNLTHSELAGTTIRVVPTVVVVSGDGVVAHVSEGAIEGEDHSAILASVARLVTGG